MLWFDNKLLTKGEAFTNHSSLFYPTASHLSGSFYSSPFRQFVSDYSVSGAIIPSGVYADTVFTSRGTSGLKIDFNNGRVIFNNGITPAVVSGDYAIKDFNVYYTNEPEEQILFQTKYHLRPKTFEALSGLEEGDKTFPSIFIKYNEGTNKPVAFGGMDSSNVEFQTIVLADSNYGLEGVCSIFRDTARSNFGLFSGSQFPYDYYGDFKSGLFNYNDLINSGPCNGMYIHEVSVSKLSEKVNTDVNVKCFAAIIDFKLQIYRYPRQE